MLIAKLSLLIISSSILAESSDISTLIGGTVRIGLSNYTNLHQVLAETAVSCDLNGSPCDPAFVVMIGTQQFSFEQKDKSSIFNNVESLNGEFYTTEFKLFRELPDTLFVSVTIEDNDAFSPAPQIIAQTVIELRDLLPSVPGRQSNTQIREVSCTPINRFVTFTLTAEVQCFHGLHGRRCSTRCEGGSPVYPTCNSGDVNCSRSLEVIGCTSAGYAFAATFQIFVAVAATAAFLLVLAIVIFSVIRCKRQGRLANERNAFLGILDRSQQQSQQQSASNSTESHPATVVQLQQAPLMLNNYPSIVRSSEYKNPVYHQQQVPDCKATRSNAHHVDEQEVYEEVEDGTQVPPLPPKNTSRNFN